MIFKVECPGCKKKYDVHNSFGAKPVACDCGAKFTLPAAPPDGDYQVCPDCRELSSNDSVICTTCGFNFKTGGKVVAKKKLKADDGPGFWFKYGIMIKKLALLSIVLLAGVLGYRYYTAKPFGIAGSSPLGRFNEVSDFLVKLNFERKELPAPADYSGCKMYCFNNAKAARDSRGMIDESIIAIADNAGIIQAFSGRYSVPDAALNPNGTVVSRFFRRLREEAGIPEQLNFKSVTHGSGRLAWTENICDWTGPGSRIYWSRVDNAQGLVASSQKLAITLPQYSAEKTLKSSVSGGEDDDSGQSSGQTAPNISKGIINKVLKQKPAVVELEE